MCQVIPFCVVSDCDGVSSSSIYRDTLYLLDTELHLWRNLTWETDGSLLSMCSDSTVSTVALLTIFGQSITPLCLFIEVGCMNVTGSEMFMEF